MDDPTCRHRDGCAKTNIVGRGLCAAHYTQSRRDGTLKDYPALRGEQVGKNISAAKKGRKFSEAHKTALSAAQAGKKQTEEHKAKCLERRLGMTYIRGPLTEKQRLHLIKARAVKGPTRVELALRALLDEMGVEFDEQVPVGNHTVDAYVPKLHLVVEADGWYWHQNAEKDRLRDAYLLRNPLVHDVLHLTDQQLAPWTPIERTSGGYRPHRFSQAA